MNMENEKVACITIPSLDHDVFQFPLNDEFTVSVTMNEIEPETFEQLYRLFNDQFRINLKVIDLKIEIEGAFSHMEFIRKDLNGNIDCLVQISNVDSFIYQKN